MTDKNLIYEILSVVEEIPEGKVATYGQIAQLIGRDKNARLVGKVLSISENYGNYPCHRVVNHSWRLAPGWTEQEDLLRQEGVTFKDKTHVNLKLCKWDCWKCHPKTRISSRYASHSCEKHRFLQYSFHKILCCWRNQDLYS